MGYLHPIPDAPDLPLETRVLYLELYLGRLWDEVWWHQLPFYERWWYYLQGYRSPVQRFYGRT